MMNGVLAAGYFLFSMAFGLITFVLWLRILMRYFRVSTLHPIAQVVYRFSNPIVLPLTHLMRIKYTTKQRYDWPCIALLIVVEIAKFLLISWLFFTAMLSWSLLIVYPIADLIIQPLNLFFYAVLIRVIMSWVNPLWRHPLNDLLVVITEPTLSYARRYIPPIAGLDFSPFVVLIVIKVIAIFISGSLPYHLI